MEGRGCPCTDVGQSSKLSLRACAGEFELHTGWRDEWLLLSYTWLVRCSRPFLGGRVGHAWHLISCESPWNWLRRLIPTKVRYQVLTPILEIAFTLLTRHHIIDDHINVNILDVVSQSPFLKSRSYSPTIYYAAIELGISMTKLCVDHTYH